MTLLRELRQRGFQLEATGTRLKIKGPSHLLTPALRLRLVTHKAAILVALKHGALEERIRFARSEDELDTLIDLIQDEFEANDISQAEAERLTHLVINAARQLTVGLADVPITSTQEQAP